MASEASKEAVRGNMHIGTRVIEVAEFKSEVKIGLYHFCRTLVSRAIALKLFLHLSGAVPQSPDATIKPQRMKRCSVCPFPKLKVITMRRSLSSKSGGQIE